jgi:anion-transporting  ArsA/GET3 family ATPase
MSERMSSMADVVRDSRIIVCCGSGGVGKTTSAAALALAAAESGRKVVLITIDPAKRLADALGLQGLTNDPSPIPIDGTAVDGAGGLWAMMLDARATFDAVIRQQARNEAQVRRILENPFYDNVASKLSGSQEYMAAEKLYELSNDDRFDLVVVDTPPTREALDFLEAPQKLMNFLDHRVYRWLIAPARSGLKIVNIAAQPILRTIGRVIGADVLADAINFFQAFEGIESGFRDRAESVQKLLKSDVTKYLVVASPRRDTVDEAIYFSRQLRSAGMAVTGLIVNRLQPLFGPGTAEEAESAARAAQDRGETDLAVLHRNLAHLRRISEAEEDAIAPLLSFAANSVISRVYQRSEDVHDIGAIRNLGRDLVAPREND